MSRLRRQRLSRMLMSCAFLIVCVSAAEWADGQHDGRSIAPAAKMQEAARSVADFETIVPVLRHPRCMNCHSTGDYPRQGDDSHPHIMNVRRGKDGHGANAVKCSTCHQDRNLPGVHMPPGAEGWALPSPAMPMIWEGLTDRQLCLLLKDPHQNGHRNQQQIVEHMHTPLVLWGWNPGDGRIPIPMRQEVFLEKVGDWVATGSACPVDRARHP